MAESGILTSEHALNTLDDKHTPVSVANMREYDKLQLARFAPVYPGYTGGDLAQKFADEIAEAGGAAQWLNARAFAGNYEGLSIGDYIDITLSDTDSTVFRYRIADFDHDLHALDQEVTTHHIDLIPDQVWDGEIHWNNTNTNNGTASQKHPYLASSLHTWELNTFLTLMPAEWRSVMVERRSLLEERYSASSQLTDSTGWSWDNMGKIWSLSEMEVYGCTVWGTKGYSTGADTQYPLFTNTASRIRHNHNGDRYSWWLRSALGGSATHACIVDAGGVANHNTVTNAHIRPLPCFRVGVQPTS